MDAVTVSADCDAAPAPFTLPLAQPASGPVSVFAVAEHLLEIGGEMEVAKLEALVYFSQAWHLAATGLPMFTEPIEAWAEGPVVAVLHEALEGHEIVAPGFFDLRLNQP